MSISEGESTLMLTRGDRDKVRRWLDEAVMELTNATDAVGKGRSELWCDYLALRRACVKAIAALASVNSLTYRASEMNKGLFDDKPPF